LLTVFLKRLILNGNTKEIVFEFLKSVRHNVVCIAIATRRFLKKMSSDGGASNIAKFAVLSFLFTVLVITIAFSTNSWLETDGTLENPKFIQLGKGLKNTRPSLTDHT